MPSRTCLCNTTLPNFGAGTSAVSFESSSALTLPGYSRTLVAKVRASSSDERAEFFFKCRSSP